MRKRTTKTQNKSSDEAQRRSQDASKTKRLEDEVEEDDDDDMPSLSDVSEAEDADLTDDDSIDSDEDEDDEEPAKIDAVDDEPDHAYTGKDMSLVVERVIEWIKAEHQKNTAAKKEPVLPPTCGELSEAIKGLCNINFAPTPSLVFKILLKAGVFRPVDDEADTSAKDTKIEVDFGQVTKKLPKLFTQLQGPSSYDLLMILKLMIPWLAIRCGVVDVELNQTQKKQLEEATRVWPPLPKTRGEAEEIIKKHFSSLVIPSDDVVEELAIQDEIQIKKVKVNKSSEGNKRRLDPSARVIYSDALFKTNTMFYFLSGLFFFLLVVLPVLLSLEIN